MSEQLPDIDVVHGEVQARMNGRATDFELASRELANVKPTNALELPSIPLEEGIGYAIHSTINGTLYTGRVEFDSGNLISDPQYEEGAAVEAIVVGLWPRRDLAAVYHVRRPMDSSELSKSLPARPILQQVIEAGSGLGYEKLTGSPDDAADLYVLKYYADPIDFNLTEQTQLTSSRIIEKTEAGDESPSELVSITLVGPVEIDHPLYYIKVDAEGVKESQVSLDNLLEITLPEKFMTFQIELPEVGSTVQIRDRSLIAVRPGFEFILDDARSLEELRTDAARTHPDDNDALNKKYGIVILPNPQIDVAAHPIVADAQGWKDWHDFTNFHRTKIESLVRTAQLHEAHETAKRLMLDALSGDDAQPATTAAVIGVLEVADYLRTQA